MFSVSRQANGRVEAGRLAGPGARSGPILPIRQLAENGWLQEGLPTDTGSGGGRSWETLRGR